LTQSPAVQNEWELDLSQGFRVSRLTVQVRWPRLSRKMADLIETRVGRAGAILDIGAGPGNFYEQLRGRCRQYVGLEPSLPALARFQPEPGKLICRGYGERLPLRGELFDAVVVKAALDHCFDPKGVVSEAYRVLKPGGEIFLLLTNDGAWYKRILRRHNEARKKSCGDHNFFFSAEQVASLLADAGYSRVRAFGFDYLRGPIALENIALALAGPALTAKAMDLADWAAGSFFPCSGGSFICTASKER
jgi:SAM-dependent methyltransferase